ncbi:molybdopterin cofactor-binding domain-containing protein [Chloroflexota bacterium]
MTKRFERLFNHLIPPSFFIASLTQELVPFEGGRSGDIHIVTGDTDATMFDIGSHASRSTYVIGNTVLGAAQEAKELEVSAEELDIKDNQLYVKSTPDKGNTIVEICRSSIYNFEGECLNISGRCSFTPLKSPAFQAAFAEVQLDTESGIVILLKMMIADDIGRAVNYPTASCGVFSGDFYKDNRRYGHSR